MRKVLPGLLFTFFLSILPVSAQMVTNPTQWYVNNQIYSMRVFNSVVANSNLLRKNGGKTRQPPVKPGKTTPATDYTVFKATPTSSLPKAFAAKLGGANQREAEQSLNAFIDLYKQTAQKDGFPANDLAYAFEYFVVNNYQVYHDLIDLPLEKDPYARRAKDGFERITLMSQKKLAIVTISQERAIYNQFKNVLASNTEIQKMTDAQKQEVTELFAIMFGVNYSGYLKGVNDENDQLTEQGRQMAKEGLEKLLGVPVAQIKITSYGLEL